MEVPIKNIIFSAFLISAPSISFATYKSVSISQFTCESIGLASNGLPASLDVYKHFTEKSDRTIVSAFTENGTAEGLTLFNEQITEQSISIMGNSVSIKIDSPKFSLSIPLSAFSPDEVETAVVNIELKKYLTKSIVRFNGNIRCRFPKWIDPNPFKMIVK